MPKVKTLRSKKEFGRTLAKAGDEATDLSWNDYSTGEVPGTDTSNDGDKSSAFEKARLLARTNYWLRGFLQLRRFILNHGFTLEVAGAKKGKKMAETTDKDIAALASFMAEEIQPNETFDETQVTTLGIPSGCTKTNQEVIEKFVEDCWNEFLLMDNCTSFWMVDQTPVILPIEKCRYADTFGVETLFFTHGLTQQQLKFFPPEVAQRFALPEIPIDFRQQEFFKVLKNEMIGNGYAWPSIQSVFRALATMENLERGESAYSFLARLKWRHHKIGYEIKSGPMAGKSTHHWKIERAGAIQKIFEKKEGVLGDFTSNFDHAVEFPHEPIEYYKADKWASAEHRLIRWGGPVAMLYEFGESVIPYIAQFMFAEAQGIRRKMGTFLSSVLNQSMNFPVPVKPVWDNTIFTSPQIMSDVMKTALSGGAIAQDTYREWAGMNNGREKTRKFAEAEAAKKNPEYFQPAYDPNHSTPNTPGASGAPSKGGKPSGKPDTQPKA